MSRGPGQQVIETGLRSWLILHSDLTALLASAVAVYREESPPNGGLPCVIFQRQSGGPQHVLKDAWSSRAMYVVRGVTEGHSMALAGSIDAAIGSALEDQSFTLSSGSVIYCRRVEDVDYPEPAPGGVRYNHRGGLYEIWTTP